MVGENEIGKFVIDWANENKIELDSASEWTELIYKTINKNLTKPYFLSFYKLPLVYSEISKKFIMTESNKQADNDLPVIDKQVLDFILDIVSQYKDLKFSVESGSLPAKDLDSNDGTINTDTWPESGSLKSFEKWLNNNNIMITN